MAKITLGSIVNTIAGGVGDVVYSCWKGISYVKSRPPVVGNPKSDDQKAVRERLTATSKRWGETLTDEQRAEWEEFADEQGTVSILVGPNTQGGAGQKQIIPDNGGVMSGFNSYQMSNLLNFTAGVHAVGEYQDDAPLGISSPNSPTGLTHSQEFAGIKLLWTDPQGAPADTRIRVWGLSVDAGFHKQEIANVALGVGEYLVDKMKGLLGEDLDIVFGKHYHFQIDAVATGLKSGPSNTDQPTWLPPWNYVVDSLLNYVRDSLDNYIVVPT